MIFLFWIKDVNSTFCFLIIFDILARKVFIFKQIQTQAFKNLFWFQKEFDGYKLYVIICKNRFLRRNLLLYHLVMFLETRLHLFDDVFNLKLKIFAFLVTLHYLFIYECEDVEHLLLFDELQLFLIDLGSSFLVWALFLVVLDVNMQGCYDIISTKHIFDVAWHKNQV